MLSPPRCAITRTRRSLRMCWGRLDQSAQQKSKRVSTTQSSTAPTDDIGKTGIERSFEDILRGTPGFRRIEVDALNNLIEVREDIAPIPGNDVVLTIDINLQAKVERELQLGIEAARTEQITVYDAERQERAPTGEFFPAPAGAAVMIDPDDGAVLAMASYPTFDPQLFIGEN